MCLLGVALALCAGYFSPRLVGTGDALWYHNELADAVTQFRAGVFPVFVGQSDYAFNGAVYPIRAAPYFQYLAGALDLVTGHRLGFFALQHLTVFVSVISGALSAYLSLVWIAPRRRWHAFAFAAMYVACPGVIGLFYSQDLYMSGMTIPWVPVAMAAAIRTFDDGRLAPRAVLAASLSLLWWAHSPIALWATLIASMTQVVRHAHIGYDRPDAIRSVCAAGIFCILAAYPVASVFLLRSPGEPIVPYLMDRSLLLHWVKASFPASLLPIDPALEGLFHLQLGFGLWACFLAAVAAWALGRRQASVGTMLAAVVFMLVLVFPVPGITKGLWLSFPETVVGMTLYWPMQRFYVLIAGCVVVAAQRTLADLDLRRSAMSACGVVLALAVLWSAAEARKIVSIALSQSGSVADSALLTLPENVAIQQHTYGLFPKMPSYFSDGVVDARLESHLLDRHSGVVITSDYDSALRPGSMRPFTETVDANPGILDLGPPIRVEPDRLYFLTFAFSRAHTIGILQMRGPNFRREYSLPESGEAGSFGSDPPSERSIALWTSLASPQEINLRFIPGGAGDRPATYGPFADFKMAAIDTAKLPIEVTGLIPYAATVRSPADAMLETPRMYVPGYAATVNGKEVPATRSREGLVQIPVPSGLSRVVLRYPGPPALSAAFWISLAGWILGAMGVLVVSTRREA